MSNTVWSADKGWHDGPETEVSVDGAGRITATDGPKYVATVNTPGYLPQDDDPPVFDTPREAWRYLVSEVERSWDDYPEDGNGACVEAHTQLHNINQDEPGVVYAPTPGYDGSHDLGTAYCVSIVEDES
jgi:hypothetical protein